MAPLKWLYITHSVSGHIPILHFFISCDFFVCFRMETRRMIRLQKWWHLTMMCLFEGEYTCMYCSLDLIMRFPQDSKFFHACEEENVETLEL